MNVAPRRVKVVESKAPFAMMGRPPTTLGSRMIWVPGTGPCHTPDPSFRSALLPLVCAFCCVTVLVPVLIPAPEKHTCGAMLTPLRVHL